MLKKITREEMVIVLDYLPNGYPFDTTPSHRKNAIVQALGKDHFTLLELIPKKNIRQLQPGEEIYIGEGKREEIHHILGKLPLQKLTATAKAELEYSLEKLVTEKEKVFVEFFNKSVPLSTRMHQLELLPGLGKKHMWEIIEERKVKPFESFADIKARVKLLPNPKKIVINRIMEELKNMDKHRVFVDA